jgi:hypothetical protein
VSITKGKLASWLAAVSFGSGLLLGSGFEVDEMAVSGVAAAAAGGGAAGCGGVACAGSAADVAFASKVNFRLAGAYSHWRSEFSQRLQRGRSPEHLVF